MGYGYGTIDAGFQVMSVIVPIIFLLVVGVFVTNMMKGIGTWNKNNDSPQLTVDATVVSKRMDVSRMHHANAGDITGAHGFHTSSATRYYTTFQVASEDRMEFSISGQDYGLFAEGDQGQLSFQGTRFLSFQRKKSQ